MSVDLMADVKESLDAGKSLIASKLFDKALTELKDALSLLQENDRMNDPSAATVIAQIGYVYRLQAAASPDAVAYLKDAMNVMNNILPKPNLAIDVEVANMAREVGRHTYGQIVDKLYNSVHVLGVPAETDSSVIKEAKWITILDNLDLALRVSNERLPGVEFELKEQTPAYIANAFVHLHKDVATPYYLMGEMVKGLAIYQKTCPIIQYAFPDGHNTFGICLANVGIGLNALGNYSGANIYFDQALSMLNSSSLEDKNSMMDQVSGYITANYKLIAPVTEEGANDALVESQNASQAVEVYHDEATVVEQVDASLTHAFNKSLTPESDQ